MIYDTGTIIIAAPSQVAAKEALLQYGVLNEPDPAISTDTDVTIIPTILIATTYAEALATVSALPNDTRWCLVDGAPNSLKGYMISKFGGAVRMPDAIRALNDEYAINPKLLNR